MSDNEAAWLVAPGKPLEVRSAPTPTAGAGQLVIETRAVAFCPVECRIQKTGGMVKEFPIILGFDVAGEVKTVGEGVQGFSVGDRVLAFASNTLDKNATETAAFQKYVQVRTATTVKIPDNMELTDAVVLPLSIATAGAALYAPKQLGLPLPSLGPKTLNKVILVWGGASAIGTVAIQLAKASGLTVLTTASKNNLDMVQSEVGADKVFDYRAPNVVDDIVAAIHASGKEFAGVVDAIAEPETLTPSIQVVKRVGSGSRKVMYTRHVADQSVFDGVEGAFINIRELYQAGGVLEGIFGPFATKALSTGQLKALPKALIVGQGLQDVQKGLDRLSEGVSARKVVVKL